MIGWMPGALQFTKPPAIAPSFTQDDFKEFVRWNLSRAGGGHQNSRIVQVTQPQAGEPAVGGERSRAFRGAPGQRRRVQDDQPKPIGLFLFQPCEGIRLDSFVGTTRYGGQGGV